MGITKPVPTLRVGWAGHDAIRLDEPPNGWIIIPCDIVHYRKHGNASLAGKSEVGLRDCANFLAYLTERHISLLGKQVPAAIHDPRWRAELKRLEKRIGRNKAIVAIARKMLVLVWHLLAEEAQDRKADAERLARKYLEFAYVFATTERGQSAQAFVRERLDLLGVGRELEGIPQGKRRIPLPPSELKKKACPELVKGK